MSFFLKLLGLQKKSEDSPQEKKMTLLEKATKRPMDPLVGYSTTGQGEIIHIRRPLDLPTIYGLALQSAVIRTCWMAIRKETFRRGFDEITPKFQSKCVAEDCGEEYDKEIDTCEACQSVTVAPSLEQKKDLEKVLKKANENWQSLMEVLRNVEDDINIADDGWIIIVKEYMVSPEAGEIYRADVKEFIRASPILMRFVMDPLTSKPGGKYWVCPIHRDVIELEKGKSCPECNMKLQDVLWVGLALGAESPSQYYIKGEVIHFSKYSPSITYGFSPVITLWHYGTTLLNSIIYVNSYYKEARHPKGVVTVTTNNPDAIQKQWKLYQDRAKQDPHYVPIIGVESESGRGAMAFLSFMSTLQEMQYVEARKEMRERISALYGVSNVFMADTSTSGGLNNEGLQILVTNRAVEDAQQIYNDKVLPQILASLRITDWELEILPSEEQDEAAELERQLTKTQIAQAMLQMGFDVTYEDEKFAYSGTASRQETPSPFSPFSPSTSPTPGDSRRMSGLPPAITRKFEGEEEVQRVEGSFENTMLGRFRKNLLIVLKRLKDSSPESEEQALALINEWSKEFDESMREVGKEYLEDAYRKGVEQVTGSTGFVFDQPDKDAIKAIETSSPFFPAFKHMRDSVAEKLKEQITIAYKTTEEFDLNKMVKKMSAVAGDEAYRMERIARTETSAITNLGREQGFHKVDPEGEQKYRWGVRHDSRTTEICKEIERRVNSEGGAVSIGRLKEIINDVSKAGNPSGWQTRDWVPHINCRSGLERVV